MLWAECQEHFRFEGLLFHCPGVLNQCADIASRWEANAITNDLRDELDSYDLHHISIHETATVWENGNVSASLLDTLTSLSIDAIALEDKRKARVAEEV